MFSHSKSIRTLVLDMVPLPRAVALQHAIRLEIERGVAHQHGLRIGRVWSRVAGGEVEVGFGDDGSRAGGREGNEREHEGEEMFGGGHNGDGRGTEGSSRTELVGFGLLWTEWGASLLAGYC